MTVDIKKKKNMAAADGFAPASGSFSTVFWDLVFSATGLRGVEIDGLRQRVSDTSVCEETNRDYSWTDVSTVRSLRDDLQQYIATLQQLKAENTFRATNKRPKSFVDEKKYQALRSREADQRITCSHIVQRMKSLQLAQRGLSSLTSELCLFSNVAQLNICRNKHLGALDFLPPNVRVVFASGCAIQSVSESVMQSVPKLLYLSVSANRLEDITFLAFSTSLASVDLSYNEISSFDHIVDALKEHPSITEVVLLGNPVTLIPFFRERIASSCKKLLRLDEKLITSEERNWKAPSVQLHNIAGSVPLRVQLLSVKGVTGLQLPEEIQRVLSAGKTRGAAPSKDAKKNTKIEEEKKDTTHRRTTFSLFARWPGIVEGKTDQYDAVPPPPAEEAAQQKGAKLGGKKPAAASAVNDQPLADELTLKYELSADAVIERNTAALLARPMEVELIVHDHVTAPGADQPRSTNFVLGRFLVDNRLVLTTGSSMQENVPLQLDESNKIVMQRRIKKMTQHLGDMQREDRNLDAVLNEALHQYQTTPPPDAQPTVQTGKKGEKQVSGKGAVAVRALSDELVKLQNESSARKLLIDELSAQLNFEERRMNKLLQSSLTLTALTGSGMSAATPPPPTVTPAGAATSVASSKK